MALTDEQLIEAGLRTGLLDARDVEQIRAQTRRQRLPLLPAVLAHYRIPGAALYRALAESRTMPYVEAVGQQADMAMVKKLPASLLRRKLMLPLQSGKDTVLAVTDPNDRASIDTALRLLKQPMTVAVTDPRALRLLIDKATAGSSAASAEQKEAAVEDTDIIALLDDILREGYLGRASDVHIATEEDGLRVRLRVDGRLRDYPVQAREETAAGLVSRIKVLSGLDIAETRLPQDGGFSYRLGPPIDREFNIRVATAPTRLGERITMRLLGQEAGGLTLTDLGMLEDDLQQFRKAINHPYGMILLTGPTGSGKSTTLFAALQEINSPDINIMTVENPIEYVMDGVSQIQTGHKISFADALRSLLRHDPDVLMVGEIRDFETADVAVKAAMTGHMVFSTLHTNNAVSAVTRLIDIGCERFLIGSTMTAVIAQRLVRRLCTHCRRERDASIAEKRRLGVDEQTAVQIYDAVGCAVCQGSGFSGRMGLFETLWFDEPLGRLVAQGADEEALERAAGDRLRFMWEDGCRKVLSGSTTLEEITAVAVEKLRHSPELAEVAD